MADEEEERVLEEQLQFQLNEQKDSLAAVADALSADPSNPELLSSIKDAEEGLFHLKKARLPAREADSVLEGIDVPFSSLKKYIPTTWEQSLVGSTIWALSDIKPGIWRQAELESWDEELKTGQIVFRDDGSSTNLGTESITLSQYAEKSDVEEESDTSSDQSDSSEYEDDSSQGLGFLESTTPQRGAQTDTAIFATWENHTRGIASKMMANMGYREGMGLGASGQGILDPISVKPLRPKQSLDHAVKSVENEKNKENRLKKKRTRGGKRKRDKMLAASIKAAEAEEESKDVFTLINNQLGDKKKQKSKANGETKREDRWALLAYEDEMKNLRGRIERLEEMVNRNRKEKVVFDAAMKKLRETRKALADAEAAHASTSNAVIGKEREKKWLKF
ncbi:zinc finger CCCH domain-containing protein 18 [Phtheirospermum japonicum]|uniref:Zinc finger CCCH domain-containing protein 18 n=1 Tax=Phtheirospermum japonicum TaxID=374723 RepID=A0A830CGF7_9LAMI|nr:zinc finger CCCH domain-containing protein 18 [Phtheirospermum japonicum]